MMEKEQLLRLLPDVVSVAKDAGAKMRDRAETQIYEKGGHANFVTSMDLAIQTQIIGALAAKLPEAEIFAEEKKENRKPEGLCWFIDPIDGTNNYILGYPHSSVSIGLIDRNEGVLGVVYDPYLDEVFCAAKGCGAYRNQTSIHPVPCPKEQCLIGFGTSPYRVELRKRTFRAAEKLCSLYADVRRSGSAALDLCYVAAGRTAGFFEYVLSPWDYAAASVIVREAGAVITATCGEPWTFDHPIGICAYAEYLGDEFLRTVNRFAEEEETNK